MPTMAEVDAMDREAFVRTFGSIYEHSPWVAEVAFEKAPFRTAAALQEALAAAVRAAPPERRLALIRAHPDLAGRAALAGEVTADSAREQASAGLDRLTEEEHACFHALNDAYRAKFGFPFIMAVKGAGKAQILAGFEARLPNDVATETATALAQIDRIAGFRLAELVQG